MVQVIKSAAPMAAPSLVQIRPREASGHMGEIKQIFFIYTFFRELTYSQTRRWIFTLAGSNDADARKGVPFGGFVDTAPHFEGEISPNPSTPILGRE